MVHLNKFFICVIVILCHQFVSGQMINLTNNWKISFDDNPAYASNTFDDTKWQAADAGKPWEEAAKNSFDGIGWYRKTITLSKKLLAQAQKTGFLFLELGRIDDADETFFNGIKIGSTGKFPPEKVSAYSVNRAYKIPVNLIKKDMPNVIAVRVGDWGGNGGMYDGKFTIMPFGWMQQLEAIVKNRNSSNAFSLDEAADVSIAYKNESKENAVAIVKCTLKTFTDSIVTILEKPIKIKVTNSETVNFSFKKLKVGFYKTSFELKSKQGNTMVSKYAFAVAPELAKVADDKPADFDEFWKNAKEELAAVAPDFKLIPKPGILDDSKYDVFLLEMKSLGNALIRGWYIIPKGKKNLPAFLSVPGHSASMEPYGGSGDVALLNLNIRGHGNSKDDVNPGFPGYLLSGIESNKNYIYRGAYMDCVRAIDFLCSRPEVDTSKIAVSGGSQGGALSFAAAALDGRVKMIAPAIPFLSDFRNYFKIATWPGNEFKEYAVKNNKSMEDIFNVLRYFDIKNLATKITCPVYMGVGLYDDTCPPATNFAAYNNVNCTDKEYILYPTSGHTIPNEHYTKMFEWLKKKIK
jgi:cephalosporin-C deacetylase